MASMSKNKLMIWLIALLVVANIASIITYWVARDRQPPPARKGMPSDFLINALNLDTLQQAQFLKLVKDHREGSAQLRGKLREAKDGLFDLLKKENVPDTTIQQALLNIGNATQKLDLLTYYHFQKVKALCTIEQKVKFDRIIDEVMGMMGQQAQPPKDQRKDDLRPGQKEDTLNDTKANLKEDKKYDEKFERQSDRRPPPTDDRMPPPDDDRRPAPGDRRPPPPDDGRRPPPGNDRMDGPPPPIQ